jgi:hypothetical protein
MQERDFDGCREMKGEKGEMDRGRYGKSWRWREASEERREKGTINERVIAF